MKVLESVIVLLTAALACALQVESYDQIEATTSNAKLRLKETFLKTPAEDNFQPPLRDAASVEPEFTSNLDNNFEDKRIFTPPDDERPRIFSDINVKYEEFLQADKRMEEEYLVRMNEGFKHLTRVKGDMRYLDHMNKENKYRLNKPNRDSYDNKGKPLKQEKFQERKSSSNNTDEHIVPSNTSFNSATHGFFPEGYGESKAKEHRVSREAEKQKIIAKDTSEIKTTSVKFQKTTAVSDEDPTSRASSRTLNKTEAAACRFGIHFAKKLSVHDGTYEATTCFFCYQFIPNHRKKFALDLDYVSYTFSYDNLTDVAFNPSDEESWAIVRQSLIDEVEAQKLETCCQDAVDCCDRISQDSGKTEETYCPATWDGWSCFSDPAPANTSVPVKCPVYAYSGYPECYLYGEKTCTADGAWFKVGKSEYTNYSKCAMESYHNTLYYSEIAAHCVSILTLVPAILILLSYRQLQKPQQHMFLNFYIALLLRSVLTVVQITVIKIPENKNQSTVMEDNGAGCKVLATLVKMSVLSVWVWMLANCVFLYRAVARALEWPTNIKKYYLSAWGVTILLTLAWATCRLLLEDYQCWMGDQKGDALKLYLITDIPIIIALAANVVLLSHMSYLLCLNFKGRTDSTTEDHRRAFRAIVFLVPIFGVQFILSALVFTGQDCKILQVQMFFAIAMSGLQGVCCSIVYCFMHTEVQRELQKTWDKLTSRWRPQGDSQIFGHSGVTPQTTYSMVHSETQGAVELVPLNSRANEHC